VFEVLMRNEKRDGKIMTTKLNLHFVLNAKTQRHRDANAVVQVSNRPYRRFPTGPARFITGAPERHAAQTVRAWKGRARTPPRAADRDWIG